MTAEQPEVLVRADAGRAIGTGHVMRMLTLANRLAARGARVTFAMAATTETLARRIEEAGHAIIRLGEARNHLPRPWPETARRSDAEETVRRVGGRWDLVVVDHYALDAVWESRIREIAATVVVVDDLADRDRDCDVLVDQNWYGPGSASRYDGRVPDAARLLLGPRYALLQSEYARLRRQTRPQPQWPPRRVLVSFGGTDATDETRKVIAALQEATLQELVADIAVGSEAFVSDELQHAIRARANTHLHVAAASLAPFLHQADVAIGASGAGTWERICLGTPAIVATSRPDQSGVTEQLHRAGLTTWIGLARDTTPHDYEQILQRQDPLPLPPPLVDGLGAERVAAALLPTTMPSVSSRPAFHLDAPMFLGTDRGAPAHWHRMLDGPDVWRQCERAFVDEVDRDDGLLVLESAGLPVGRARASVLGDRVEIVFAIDDFAAGDAIVAQAVDVLSADTWSISTGQLCRHVGGGGRRIDVGLSPFGGVVTLPFQEEACP